MIVAFAGKTNVGPVCEGCYKIQICTVYSFNLDFLLFRKMCPIEQKRSTGV